MRIHLHLRHLVADGHESIPINFAASGKVHIIPYVVLDLRVANLYAPMVSRYRNVLVSLKRSF